MYFSLEIDFILANMADPDDMPHYETFHLDLHCLPKYLFTDISNEKGANNHDSFLSLFILSFADSCGL